MKSPKAIEAARKAATAPELQAKDSDERFNAVLATLRPGAPKSKTEAWANAGGEKLAKISSNAQRVVVTVDRKQSPAFADFLLTRVKDLYDEFQKSGAGKGA
jgi:ParB family chromosome partitioning protein